VALMRKRSNNLVSEVTRQAVTCLVSRTASKGAVVMNKAMALELAPEIRGNALARAAWRPR